MEAPPPICGPPLMSGPPPRCVPTPNPPPLAPGLKWRGVWVDSGGRGEGAVWGAKRKGCASGQAPHMGGRTGSCRWLIAWSCLEGGSGLIATPGAAHAVSGPHVHGCAMGCVV
jgi:hypothetical protein